MFPLQPFFIDLAILTVVFTVFVVGTLLWKPRIWLHDFPADIQAMAAPKTDAEKGLTRWLGGIFMLVFFGLPLILTWDLKAVLGADFTFWAAWLYAYALFVGVNLWDLVALDWLGFALIDPQKPPFPGTEGAAGWRNYAFHFYGFLKGCVIGLAFATFVASVVTLLA
jgi:hypothetical protein